MALPAAVMTSLIPVITQGIGRIFDRIFGVKESPEVAIKRLELDIRKFEALQQADSSIQGASQWVSNLRGSMRPVMGLVILLAWTYIVVMENTNVYALATATDLAASVMFYLFGERTMLYMSSFPNQPTVKK